MKAIKTLGLAVLGVLMAMALVGASSAMAESTQLCKDESSPCSSPSTSIHEVSIGKAVLESALPTIECNVLFMSTSVGELGTPQIVEGNVTYTACNNFCTVKEENGPSVFKVLKTGEELVGVVGEGLVRVTCPFINCTYIGEGLEGHGLGALAAANWKGEVSIPEQELRKEAGGGEGGCPEEAFLTVTLGSSQTTYIGS